MYGDLLNDYFTSYEALEVHQLMLEDHARTSTFKKAILNNKEYFKDKVVMDVGCGTGILSIFCAQAGAKKVYAVEASNLATLAQEVVKENNFENIIEVIQSRVEDVKLPDNTKVDAIVSEWMGFYLLHEGMLDSVLVARDRFLKEGGEMFPKSACVYVTPCSVPSLYNKWESFHGVSMTTFAKHLRASKGHKPVIMDVQPEDLLAPEVALRLINLKEDMISDLDSFSIESVVGVNKSGCYQGLCLWFECMFPELSGSGDGSHEILNTSPASASTHWKQTVIVLPQTIEVDEGEPIAFQIDMNRDRQNSRRYNLEVTMLDPEKTAHPMPCSCHMTKCIIIKAFMTQNAMQKDEVHDGADCLVDEEISDEDNESQ